MGGPSPRGGCDVSACGGCDVWSDSTIRSRFFVDIICSIDE